MTDVETRLAALEAEVRELKDVREINDVMRRWHYACTGGFNGHPVHRTQEGLELLTADATIEVQGLHLPGGGPHGEEELMAYFKPYHGDNGLLPMVFQTGVDYGVKVTGDTAVQNSNIIILTKYRDGGNAYSMSRYENLYERTPQGWKIKKIQLEQGFTVPLEQLMTATEYFSSTPDAIIEKQKREAAAAS
jgi:ketosteroid isomerase-like protein